MKSGCATSAGQTAISYSRHATLLVVSLAFALSGCQAVTNPVANGIPVRRLPPEFLGESRESKQAVPLALLRQQAPSEYRLAAGDVLGVYIEGVLGAREEPIPVNFSDFANLPPALGYPIPVREDGNLPLPLIQPVSVEKLTITEAEQAIIDAYVKTQTLKVGRERIIVTLIRPRQTRVLVLRQDSPFGSPPPRPGGRVSNTRAFGGSAELLIGGSRNGTGTIVDLPAYENDILNALAQTGGLPGLDAANEVVIQRGYYKANPGFAAAMGMEDGMPIANDPMNEAGARVIRIPLRIQPGQELPFKPEDVILHEGDIVSIEARRSEVFYTGGYLPTGEYSLPRDYDLDVVEAVSQVGGPLINGGRNAFNLSGDLVPPGVGHPNPSLLAVIRRLPNGTQITIRVDINKALRDPRESLRVQAGDVLILQETPGEAFARYFSEFFNFTFIDRSLTTSRSTGTTSLSVP